MTVLTLYRAPRRILRKLLKPLALRLNAYRFWLSEHEAYRLQVTAESLRRAGAKEYRHQVRLMQQRREVEGW
jgi:hypothetical protein